MTTQKINLFNLGIDGLVTYFEGIGEKKFRAAQIMKWIYQRGVTDFDQMTDLSKALRTRLSAEAEVRPPEMVITQDSDDGTKKWLLRLDDGNCIETVFIPEKDRGTLCVSSQVGCTLNCAFCSTAKQGFNRNLSAGEIIGQLWHAATTLGQFELGSDRIVTNVVMMGMGEPLLNYDNVVAALKIMMDDNAFGLSRRRVTLSTAGVVPALERLISEVDCALAVSLHAVNDELRDELVPINKKYPIDQLMSACRKYVDKPGNFKVTIEYVMLNEINDSPEEARRLIKLLKGIPSKVNLIPFNPFPNTSYVSSSPDRILRFQRILYDAGIVTTVRKTRGEDIDAACGQLAGKVKDKTRRSIKLLKAAGE